jgi:hypothetical protein
VDGEEAVFSNPQRWSSLGQQQLGQLDCPRKEHSRPLSSSDPEEKVATPSWSGFRQIQYNTEKQQM